MIKEIKICGYDCSLIITLDEVLGFPEDTSPFGGYEVKSIVEIKTGTYHAKGELWFTTGNLYDFYVPFAKCLDQLDGIADFTSYERNLQLSATFDKLGHVEIKGSYREYYHSSNELTFSISTDQSYLKETRDQLSKCYELYGDNYGKSSKIRNRGHVL